MSAQQFNNVALRESVPVEIIDSAGIE